MSWPTLAEQRRAHAEGHRLKAAEEARKREIRERHQRQQELIEKRKLEEEQQARERERRDDAIEQYKCKVYAFQRENNIGNAEYLEDFEFGSIDGLAI